MQSNRGTLTLAAMLVGFAVAIAFLLTVLRGR